MPKKTPIQPEPSSVGRPTDTVESFYDPTSTLAEIVVTDPRDPFVWHASGDRKPRLTEAGRQALWEMYRELVPELVGVSEAGIARDELLGEQVDLAALCATDWACIEMYCTYLDHIRAEQVVQKGIVNSIFAHYEILRLQTNG